MQLGQRGSAAAAVDGVGDPEFDGTLQSHGFEVGQGMAPQLGLGPQELNSTAARHGHHRTGLDCLGTLYAHCSYATSMSWWELLCAGPLAMP